MNDIARELLKLAKDLVSSKPKWDLYLKRNGKIVKWNKRPMTMREAEDMMSEIEKSDIPSIDYGSFELRVSK